ncbi:hypothetical protein KKC97_06515, partial [bacterium]|nr:hypothetical protein [bacterium]
AALPITLVGQTSFKLPDKNLQTASEIVKWKYTVHPCVDGPLELIAGKGIPIKDDHLVPGSAVVTLNDGLDTVYYEEKDYRIDYMHGMIFRLEHGAIPDQQFVYVYYEKYELFTLSSDYTIDYEDGYIARTQNSEIPDGATVLIDYTICKGGIEDELIDQAIIEAEDIILRSLAPEYDALSTDQGLETAATLLALSIVARGLAAGTLTSDRASDAYNRAREWQNLSAFWERKAWDAMGPFLDPCSLRSPVAQ